MIPIIILNNKIIGLKNTINPLNKNKKFNFRGKKKIIILNAT